MCISHKQCLCFEKYNTLFSVKTFQTKGHLGVCSIWNTLNLENVCGENLWLCPFTELSSPPLFIILHESFFSRISPEQLLVIKKKSEV